MFKDSKPRTIIISPSGNFYGSEQVLYDHLKNTENVFSVFLPKGSNFEFKVRSLNQHKVLNFVNVKILYIRIFFRVIFRNVKTVYLNEAGHIKYIRILAFIFPNLRFVVHVRLKEDSEESRLGKILPLNVKLICISKYIFDLVKKPSNSFLIYDPIAVKANGAKKSTPSDILRIGFIGRVTTSKGLIHIGKFLDRLLESAESSNININFFGDIETHIEIVNKFHKKYSKQGLSKIIFHGYVSDQEFIYDNIDTVIHLNPEEPLGRIGLESWARNIPFFCFNLGGCYEINTLLGLDWFIVDKKPGWESQLINKLTNFTEINYNFEKIGSGLHENFSINSYVKKVESLIS